MVGYCDLLAFRRLEEDAYMRWMLDPAVEEDEPLFSWAATWLASHSCAATTGGAGSGPVIGDKPERRWAVLLGNTQLSTTASRNAEGELSFEESPEVICEVWSKAAL